jgi:hypothetical protein
MLLFLIISSEIWFSRLLLISPILLPIIVVERVHEILIDKVI